MSTLRYAVQVTHDSPTLEKCILLDEFKFANAADCIGFFAELVSTFEKYDERTLSVTMRRLEEPEESKS